MLDVVMNVSDQDAEKLGPMFHLGNPTDYLSQRSIQFRLPVPDDRIQLPEPDECSDCLSELRSDCLSELRMIGGMISEMEKSVKRFQSAICISSCSHPIVGPQTVSVTATGNHLGHSSHLGNGPIAQAPRTLATPPRQDLGANGVQPYFRGFAVSPQLNREHLKSMIPSAASPSIGSLDSTVPHELSDISPVELTSKRKVSVRAYASSNLFEQDTLIENHMLSLTPAPSTTAPSPHFALLVKSLNAGDASPNSSAAEPSVPSELTSRAGKVLDPNDTAKKLDVAAQTLKMKLQAMDAKNREIDSTLAQFFQRQAASPMTTPSGTTKQNKITRSQGMFERDFSHLQQNSNSLERATPNIVLSSPSLWGSSASFNSKMGASSSLQQRSSQFGRSH